MKSIKIASFSIIAVMALAGCSAPTTATNASSVSASPASQGPAVGETVDAVALMKKAADAMDKEPIQSMKMKLQGGEFNAVLDKRDASNPKMKMTGSAEGMTMEHVVVDGFAYDRVGTGKYTKKKSDPTDFKSSAPDASKFADGAKATYLGKDEKGEHYKTKIKAGTTETPADLWFDDQGRVAAMTFAEKGETLSWDITYGGDAPTITAPPASLVQS